MASQQDATYAGLDVAAETVSEGLASLDVAARTVSEGASTNRTRRFTYVVLAVVAIAGVAMMSGTLVRNLPENDTMDLAEAVSLRYVLEPTQFTKSEQKHCGVCIGCMFDGTCNSQANGASKQKCQDNYGLWCQERAVCTNMHHFVMKKRTCLGCWHKNKCYKTASVNACRREKSTWCEKFQPQENLAPTSKQARWVAHHATCTNPTKPIGTGYGFGYTLESCAKAVLLDKDCSNKHVFVFSAFHNGQCRCASFGGSDTCGQFSAAKNWGIYQAWNCECEGCTISDSQCNLAANGATEKKCTDKGYDWCGP